MGYIKNQQHFLNYLNKIARESNIDTEQLLAVQFYVSEIFNTGFTEDYTWALKTVGPHLLEEDHCLAWLAGYRNRRVACPEFDHELTYEFTKLVGDMERVPGVYYFTRTNGEPLYVGRSIHLGQRMLSSFSRFKDYNRHVYVQYIQTKSSSDAALLEIYFITTLNPPLNRRDNYAGDDLTLTVEPIPEWSELILCNAVITKDGNDGS